MGNKTRGREIENKQRRVTETLCKLNQINRGKGRGEKRNNTRQRTEEKK